MKKIFLLIFIAFFSSVNGATYTVTKTTDDGSGTTTGTLSWAITRANEITGIDDDDNIEFDLSSGDKITISAALPTITDAVTINETNSATSNYVTVQVTAPGTSEFRVFHINASDKIIRVSNMTILGGNISSKDSPDSYGGCIYVEAGNFVLDDVTLSKASAQNGGGIYTDNASSLTMTGCTVKENNAVVFGAGIYLGPSTFYTMTNCTVSNNTSSYMGGGIHTDASSRLTMMNCTVSNNTSPYSGGGIHMSSGSHVIMTNCTISNNTSSYDSGGGIFILNNSSLTMTSCTVTGNIANAGGGGLASIGSIYSTNSIIAYNYTSNSSSYTDIFNTGTTTYGSYNISSYTYWGGGSNNTLYSYTSGKGDELFNEYNTVTVNTFYQPVLADNGGLTETVALSTTAAACTTGVLIGSYDNSGTTAYVFDNGTKWVKVEDGTTEVSTGVTAITTDQRGTEKNSSTPSIGAYDNSEEALPVELTSFTAALVEEGVKLSWETATEVNNYGFEIERSLQTDGGQAVASDQSSEWEVIAFVEGHGNSNSPKVYEYIDVNIPIGVVDYRLKQIDTDGSFEYFGTTAKVDIQITDVNAIEELPTEFALEQNYPNPFNPSTTINYSIPVVETFGKTSLNTTLIVFDMLGREVATLVNKEQSAGYYSVNFDASKLTSGIYIYRITTGDFMQSRKMVLLR